ncbi:unnamed protein product [Tuber melanosporum]|uniref:(Perigord truffle) hypothetical protein n=1 Tax=Tuber melanosporum (strain Mel28) TaxID=656061 RepID=D5G559_TUBMM|nr:uncharacterized protein GSTUM_00000267001 [Tuber melanosporum]CAZ79644.1 unnamed protein product [Tuber melanosporum]
MPPTPPSDSSAGKKASNPTASRSRFPKAGSIARGSTSASTSSLSLKTSNNAHTRRGSNGIRKPTATAAGSVLTAGPMGPPAGKKSVNEKFDNLFFKSPVPRAISKLLSNSQSTSITNNNPAVPSSLRRSIGAGPSTSASTTAASTTAAPAAGLKKARNAITKKPTTTTPASTGKTQKPIKPTTTTTSGANGAVSVNFTLPNDGQDQTLSAPMGESSEGDDCDDGEDVIPARPVTGPTPMPPAKASLRSYAIPGTPEKLPIATRTNSVRGTNGKHVKRTKQAQKESAEVKEVVESPKGVTRNTTSSRARAAANSGVGGKSSIKAGEAQVGRTSIASVGTAAAAMPTTPAAPPTTRETRSSGLSSLLKSQARGHINAWAEARKKRSTELEPARECEKGAIIPPTPEVHIPIHTRSSTTKEVTPPPPN